MLHVDPNNESSKANQSSHLLTALLKNLLGLPNAWPRPWMQAKGVWTCIWCDGETQKTLRLGASFL